VGSNVIADAFSRFPYVALDDIFGQVRFPFSCFFLYAALPPIRLFRHQMRRQYIESHMD